MSAYRKLSVVKDNKITQYYDSTKLQQVLESVEVIVDEGIIEPLDYLRASFGARSEGFWLELLGKRFEFSRPFLHTETSKLFGFVDDLGSGSSRVATFNNAPFISDEGDTNVIPASDSLYSTLLMARIRMMRFDGSHEMFLEILNSLSEGSYFVDNLDMTVDIFLKELEETVETDIIKNFVSTLQLPVGVGSDVSSYKLFGFDNKGSTFDNGSF